MHGEEKPFALSRTSIVGPRVGGAQATKVYGRSPSGFFLEGPNIALQSPTERGAASFREELFGSFPSLDPASGALGRNLGFRAPARIGAGTAETGDVTDPDLAVLPGDDSVDRTGAEADGMVDVTADQATVLTSIRVVFLEFLKVLGAFSL